MLKRFARNQRGVTTVEFALISMLLFGIIGATVEIGMIMFAQSSLENAARAASRYGITGQTGSDGNRESAILEAARNTLPHLLDPTKLTMTMLIYNDFSSIGEPEDFTDLDPKNGQYDPGEPYDDVNGNGQWDRDQGAPGAGSNRAIVVYKLAYRWDPQFGISTLLRLTPIDLAARVIVRNEP